MERKKEKRDEESKGERNRNFVIGREREGKVIETEGEKERKR